MRDRRGPGHPRAAGDAPQAVGAHDPEDPRRRRVVRPADHRLEQLPVRRAQRSVPDVALVQVRVHQHRLQHARRGERGRRPGPTRGRAHVERPCRGAPWRTSARRRRRGASRRNGPSRAREAERARRAAAASRAYCRHMTVARRLAPRPIRRGLVAPAGTAPPGRGHAAPARETPDLQPLSIAFGRSVKLDQQFGAGTDVLKCDEVPGRADAQAALRRHHRRDRRRLLAL